MFEARVGALEGVGDTEDLGLVAGKGDDLKPDGQPVDESAGNRGGREAEPVEHVGVAGVDGSEGVVRLESGAAGRPVVGPFLDRAGEELGGGAQQDVVVPQDKAELVVVTPTTVEGVLPLLLA